MRPGARVMQGPAVDMWNALMPIVSLVCCPASATSNDADLQVSLV